MKSQANLQCLLICVLVRVSRYLWDTVSLTQTDTQSVTVTSKVAVPWLAAKSKAGSEPKFTDRLNWTPAVKTIFDYIDLKMECTNELKRRQTIGAYNDSNNEPPES